MRVPPWIVCILSVMAFSASRSGLAQHGDMGPLPGPGRAGGPLYPATQYAPVNRGVPRGGRFVPPPPRSPAGARDPIAAGQNGGPGYHPARKPWPHISPFENRFAEHTHEDGLWFFRSDNSNRRFFANVDYRYAAFRRPDVTRVGSRIAPQEPDPAIVTAPFLPIDTGTLFSSFLGNFNGLSAPNTVNNIAVNEQSREGEPTVNGFQLNWGFREPTGTGLEFSGWYTPEAHWAYSRGFNATREEVLTRTNFFTGSPLAVTHGLPLNDGLPDGLNGAVDGVYVVYDRFFGIDFQSVGGGGDVNWNFTPFWRSEWYEFAPTAGMQFLYIGEIFSLNAADSGGSLTFETPPGLEDPDSYVQAVSPFRTRILSEVKSYLTGPQIGLQFAIGGENLKLLGHSQVGLAVNHERMELSGFGVGDGFDPRFNQDFRFREEQDHTRLSPTTAHEIVAQANIFSFIPVVNRIHWLEEAKFRAGYQINAVFEVQRPHRTVQYNGLPLVPAIRNDRETRWYVESYNFGVHWDY